MEVVLGSGSAGPGEAGEAAGAPLSLPLLALITQARNEHGMRQQDVRRYRQFCSRKVHHLRQILHKTHSSAVESSNKHGKKGNTAGANSKKAAKKSKRKAQSAAVQSQNSKGTGNVFTRKSITVEDVQNDRPLQLLLFEAERAWAYSQELKQAAFDNEQDGAIRRHGLARAHRAVQWADSLSSLVAALGKSRIDALSRAEVAAYRTLVLGYETFDKSKQQESLELLSVTRKLLDVIANASDDSRKEALANSFVDSTEPMLRFSAYNLQLAEQDMDALAKATATPALCGKIVPGYADLEAELRTKAQSSNAAEKSSRLDNVDWRGRSIPIRHPDLVDTIESVLAAESDLRTALQAKSAAETKTQRSADHKRQRLTSAQRSAKRRGQSSATTSADATPAAPARAATAGSRTGMDGYDGLLAALTEAEDVARRLVKDNAEALSKSHSGRYEASSTALVEAHDYLLFKLLATRIERNAALVQEVQTKSGKRQMRLREALAHFLQSSKTKGHGSGARLTAQQKGKEPVRRHAKPSAHKVRPTGKTRKAKTSQAAAANGFDKEASTQRKQSARARMYEERVRTKADLRSRRIAVRTVPGLAKLLDANEMSCSTLGGLSLVEVDSDLTTLIEAKSAWFRAELLRFLARSFAFTHEEGKALICLQRAELYVREAQTAMELVDLDVVRTEDERIPPTMAASTFETTLSHIAEARLEVQRQVFQQRTAPRKVPHVSNAAARQAPGAAAATRNAQSKALQAVRDMASKYVDFDPIDLQQAVQLDSSIEQRFAREARGQVSAEDAGAAASRDASVRPAQNDDMHLDNEHSGSEAEVFHDDEDMSPVDGDTSAAYDPANALYEEEERLAAETPDTTQRRGWLGGWLGRK